MQHKDEKSPLAGVLWSVETFFIKAGLYKILGVYVK